jgi:hypothetical protein
MIDVYATAGTFASKHDLAQQLAAAMMRSQMWSRLAGEPRRVAAAAGRSGALVHRFSTARAVSFTARSPRPERGSGHG